MGLYGEVFRPTLQDTICHEYLLLDTLPDIPASAFHIDKAIYEQNLQLLQESDAIADVSKFFSKIGLTGTDYATLIAQAAKDIADSFLKNGVNKESRQTISNIMNNLWKDLADALPEIDDIKDGEIKDKIKGLDKNKVSKSIALLLFIVIVNTIVLRTLMILFGPVGYGIGATIMGPLSEENAKQIAIKGKFEKEFSVIFNVYEGTTYIHMLTGQGYNLSGVVKLRLLTVGMHLTTTIIQWLTNNEKILEKINIKTEDEKNKANYVGHILGLLIHGVWNGFAAFSKSFNSALEKAAGLQKIANI